MREHVIGLCLIALIISPLLVVGMTTSSRLVQIREIYTEEDHVVRHNQGDPIYVSIADNSTILRLLTSRELDIKRASIMLGEREIEMKPQLLLQGSIMWYARAPLVSGSTHYYFKLELYNGTIIHVYKNRVERYFELVGSAIVKQVDWVPRSIGYQIFPDRFFNGDPSNDHYSLIYDSLFYDNTTNQRPVLSNWSDPPHNPLHCCHQYFGGDLRGIIMKLDYLRELNVSLIYLNPIFLCGSAHCYDTYDYYKVHPRLGTIHDLRELLSEARKRGIKVIFDFVPGHVGLGFWAFQDVYVNGRNSKYWNWFTIYQYPFTPGNGRHYRCWWGFGSLPQLNTTNPEVKEYLFNVVLYWLEFGFDGVRIDTPLDVLNPREFFNELRERVKSRFPDAYIVGEIWEARPEWVNNGPFDSLMNYALGGILVSYVKGEIVDNPGYSISYYYSRYSVASAGMGFNIIGSHDTDRVLTMVGGGRLFPYPNPPREAIERLKMLSTLQYTQPGVPVIFQGDERGLPGIKLYPYEEHRYPIQWDYINEEVFSHYRKLGELKAGLPALQTSIIRVLESPRGVLAYTRGYNDEVLIIANNQYQSVTFNLPSDLASRSWRPLYSSSGEDPIIDQGSITIPPLTALVLVSEIAETSEEPGIPAGQYQYVLYVVIAVVSVSLVLSVLKIRKKATGNIEQGKVSKL